jgi:hypothetical protein
MDPYLESDLWQEFHDRLANQISEQLMPLLVPDPDATLDLQAAVDGCFTLVGYDRLLDYTQEPPAGLNAAEAAWAMARLRDLGLRST